MYGYEILVLFYMTRRFFSGRVVVSSSETAACSLFGTEYRRRRGSVLFIEVAISTRAPPRRCIRCVVVVDFRFLVRCVSQNFLGSWAKACVWLSEPDKRRPTSWSNAPAHFGTIFPANTPTRSTSWNTHVDQILLPRSPPSPDQCSRH